MKCKFLVLLACLGALAACGPTALEVSGSEELAKAGGQKLESCAVLGDCGSCAAAPGCGWCDGRCLSGSAQGPETGSCAQWSWLRSECPAPTPLSTAVQAVDTVCRKHDILCGVAVRDLSTGAGASLRPGQWFVSASSAKIFWSALALRNNAVSEIASLQTIADPVFRYSDNYATGTMIDRAVGWADGTCPEGTCCFDAINRFYAEAGMGSSRYTGWATNHYRTVCAFPPLPSTGVAGGPTSTYENTLTPADSVELLSRLWAGTLLPEPEKRSALLSWMTLSPRDGLSGAPALTQLPWSIRAQVMHKVGFVWTEGGCNNANDIGIVPAVGAAPPYAFAIATYGGQWNRKLELIGYISCVLYQAMQGNPNPAASCQCPGGDCGAAAGCGARGLSAWTCDGVSGASSASRCVNGVVEHKSCPLGCYSRPVGTDDFCPQRCGDATDCQSCVALFPCGFCDGACQEGAPTGPLTGTCADGAWAWPAAACP